MNDLRPELPTPIPRPILALPRHRGYPVPWFVEWIEGDPPRPMDIGKGTPDFRIMSRERLLRAVKYRLCWVCGQQLNGYVSYVAGPMCAINRTSAEPPSHPSCAQWSAKACPFLSRPYMRRREAGLPEQLKVEGKARYDSMPGIAITRNPGAIMVWTIYGEITLKPDGRGNFLFDIGEPRTVRWFAEGRQATRAEVDASIESGLPLLQEQAALDGPEGEAELAKMVKEVEQYLP
jgi:hypothetical protein